MCYWILTDSEGPSPFGGWGWVDVAGTLSVFWGCLMHMCKCTHTHTHTHTCMQVMMSLRDSPGFPYGSSHLHEIIMFIHVCMCAHVCVCACMCTHAWGTPQRPWQSAKPIHPPQGGNPEISQKSIKIEWIEIFEFCLKILHLWRPVHSYRLHLVCSWGGVLSQIAYFTFGPKNVQIFCSREPSGKIFSYFHTGIW